MLYGVVDFKTLSDRYTNSRMVPFLTHVDGIRANLFSMNPRQKMISTMESEQLLLFLFVWLLLFFFVCFFHLKIRCNKLFFLRIRQRSENGPHHEKTCFCHMWTTKTQISLCIHAVWSAPLLCAAWTVTRFYSSKQVRLSPTCQFCRKRLIVTCTSVQV